MAGKRKPEPQPDDEALLNSRALRSFMGGVSDMWIWRRLQSSAAIEKTALSTDSWASEKPNT
jgi:hypothetical protein